MSERLIDRMSPPFTLLDWIHCRLRQLNEPASVEFFPPARGRRVHIDRLRDLKILPEATIIRVWPGKRIRVTQSGPSGLLGYAES